MFLMFALLKYGFILIINTFKNCKKNINKIIPLRNI